MFKIFRALTGYVYESIVIVLFAVLPVVVLVDSVPGSAENSNSSVGTYNGVLDTCQDSKRAVHRPRARDIGIDVGILPTGRFNAITDVGGVLVGQKTIDKGDSIRTGVTVILPFKGNIFADKVPGAIFVGNGFGKASGISQINELGTIETPIALTNTLNVPEAMEGLIEYTLSLPGNENVISINPVVAETNDGYINDIRARAVKSSDVFDAVKNAKAGEVEEGSVGAGRGTRCLGFKGGIGTSSRVVETALGNFTVGVLVQTNFGGILTINGAPVGRELGSFYLSSKTDKGSCIVVIATDAPLEAPALKRMAKRGIYTLARTGSIYSNGSGDYAIAFSVYDHLKSILKNSSEGKPDLRLKGSRLNPIFLAVEEAVEEAIYNSLLKANTVCGYRNRCVEAIPVDRIVDVCKKYNVLNLSRHLPVIKIRNR